MLNPVTTSQFKRDYKLQLRRQKNIEILDNVIRKLSKQDQLPSHHRDHPLYGNFKNHRECHLESDWLLIYRIEGQDLYLIRTGSHSDLFG